MHSPVQYLQNMLEKAAAHQKKEKFSDRLLKHSAVNVQVSNKPVVSTQQQLGSMEAGTSGPLTNGPITQSKPLTQTLTQKPLESTGTNQVHDASSNPVRSSTPPKPPTPATTTKIPNVLKVARDTGLADVDGKTYINTEDVALLGKLGFEIGVREYSGLEKSGEVLDLYSYLEKYAEVPKAVSSAVDKGEAFSGSFLEDMGYSVPKGYEIKGDLCCPVEKTALLEKESAEKPGLWDNIRAKRARGEKAAKPGDSDYPDKKQWNKLSKEAELEKKSEYKWHKSKDLHRDVTNGRHYPFSFLTGEAKELVDAIKNRDMANFKEEIGDTTYAAQMLAAQATGLNHPVFADLSKFYKREKAWKDIFNEKGSTYHPKHMEGGSNYAKPSKIIKAFASAGIKINQAEAERIADKYTGGNMEKEAAKKIPSNQPLLPGMDQWVKKQPFNHAEHLYSKGAIPKGHRDRWVSGALADDLRPKFDKIMETIRNTPSAM